MSAGRRSGHDRQARRVAAEFGRTLGPAQSAATPCVAGHAKSGGGCGTCRHRRSGSRQHERCRQTHCTDFGAPAVLIKGGHLPKAMPSTSSGNERSFTELWSPRIITRHTHGTGCAYSAAITACLARGQAIPEAVSKAKAFVHEAIRTAPGLGAGYGPLNLWAFTETERQGIMLFRRVVGAT